jgi:hypothetical protein
MAVFIGKLYQKLYTCQYLYRFWYSKTVGIGGGATSQESEMFFNVLMYQKNC